ncbi:MAG: hypothetical protein ABIG44_01075 [Planctomycetota bacterium]
MTKRLWWKSTLLALASGTMLAFGYGGCLDATIQRVLVAVAFD